MITQHAQTVEHRSGHIYQMHREPDLIVLLKVHREVGLGFPFQLRVTGLYFGGWVYRITHSLESKGDEYKALAIL